MAEQMVERLDLDLPGVIDAGDQWYGVTDTGRTLHVVIGEVRVGVRAVCGRRVEREAVPADGTRLCLRCRRQ